MFYVVDTHPFVWYLTKKLPKNVEEIFKASERGDCVIKIESAGIDTIEDNSEFEKTFSFGVNLGLFNANWSITKK